MMLQIHTGPVRTQRQQQQQIYQTAMQQDETLSILNDFVEILQSEVYVDLERLRILARHGVPPQLRGVKHSFL